MTTHPISAHAWRSGMIEFRHFGEPVPAGAMPLPQADRELLVGMARHSRTDDWWLVPGVPEAEDEEAAKDAMFRFCFRLIQARHRWEEARQ